MKTVDVNLFLEELLVLMFHPSELLFVKLHDITNVLLERDNFIAD